ncbi:LamG domain-containing protein, partial [Candidatus Sumerlaeota bacterium]
VSADGSDWYEARNLRDLSRTLGELELDLDAAMVAAGLTYGPDFRVRICQYDNKPALMDGIALSGMALTGEAWTGPADASLVMHLALDDNAPTPLVRDATRLYHQVLQDAGGDPATAAHSAPGAGPGTGTALAFDGLDDEIDCGTAINETFAENQDFTIAYWWKPAVGAFADWQVIFGNWHYSYVVTGIVCSQTAANQLRLVAVFAEGGVNLKTADCSWSNANDNAWHHYALTRSGSTLNWYRDGALAKTETNAIYTRALHTDAPLQLGRSQSCPARAEGALDDFRLYDRALAGPELAALFALGS